jgi:hypothetical protein
MPADADIQTLPHVCEGLDSRLRGKERSVWSASVPASDLISNSQAKSPVFFAARVGRIRFSSLREKEGDGAPGRRVSE